MPETVERTASLIRGNTAAEPTQDVCSPDEPQEFDSTLVERTQLDSGESDSAARTRGDYRGSQIGGFLILRKLGEGGMGVVYAAYDERLDRRVAIKLLRSKYHGNSAAARLIREARGLARLSHPNVVNIHEIGQHEGSVFIAMEFIQGQTLREWFEAERSWREKLKVVIEAGRGLAAAHAKRLVHRDFKPDNVMVATDGRVRVLDFGLVRALDPDEVDDEDGDEDGEVPSQDSIIDRNRSSDMRGLTEHGTLLGTPAYMAPEQFAGERIDALSDQFSYCVTVYQALYGYRPFVGRSIAALAYSMETGTPQPPPANTKVPRVIHEAILRGLAIDPAQRWPNMDELLGALQAGLERRRRSRAWVGFVLLVVGIAVAATMVREMLAERDARVASEEAQRQLAEAERDASYARLERELKVAEGLRATTMAEDPARAIEAAQLALELYVEANAHSEVLPELEVAMFATSRRLHRARTLTGDAAIVSVAFSPDGALVASGDEVGHVQLWDTHTGEVRGDLDGHGDTIESLAFSPDGRLLLSADVDAKVRLWRVEGGRSFVDVGEHSAVAAAFAPDGETLALGSPDGAVSLWSVAAGGSITKRGELAVSDASADERAVEELAFAADGRLLVLRPASVEFHVLDSDASPVRISTTHTGLRTSDAFARADAGRHQLALAPDASLLAMPGPEGSIELRDTDTGKLHAALDARHAKIFALAFAPAGRPKLASAGLEGAPKLWDPRSGLLEATIELHGDPTRDLAFSADGAMLVTAGFDHHVRIVSADSGRVLETLEAGAGILGGIAVAPNGRSFTVLGSEAARLWEAERGSETRVLRAPDYARSAAIAPGAARVVLGERGGPVRVWAVDRRGPSLELDHGDGVASALAWAPDGERIAGGDNRGLVRIWAAETGELLHQLEGHAKVVSAVQFSPDGRWLATGDMNGEVRLWRVEAGELTRAWQADEGGIMALAFGPEDRELLAIAGLRNAIGLWNPSTGKRYGTVEQAGLIYALAFTPSGRLAAAGEDGEIVIWAGQTRLATLVDRGASIESLSISPDGRYLLAGSDGEVQMWDLESKRREQLARPLAHFGHFEDPSADVLAAAFTGDGQRVLSASASGDVGASLATLEARVGLTCAVLEVALDDPELASSCALR